VGRRGQDDRVVERIPATVEREGALAQKPDDDLERLLEPADSMIERDVERPVLGLVPTAAQPEDQPPAGHVVGRRGHLREQPR
jgi:hypothetical protein